MGGTHACIGDGGGRRARRAGGPAGGALQGQVWAAAAPACRHAGRPQRVRLQTFQPCLPPPATLPRRAAADNAIAFPAGFNNSVLLKALNQALTVVRACAWPFLHRGGSEGRPRVTQGRPGPARRAAAVLLTDAPRPA